MISRRLRISSALLGLTVLCAPMMSYASTGLTIQPVRVSHTIQPGENVKGIITIKNASQTAVVVDLKAEDVIPTAGGEGVQFVQRASGVTTVRDWISLNGGESSFLLEKGGYKDVIYEINVPRNAEPGSHFGVAFFKATSKDAENAALRVSTQVGALVFVTVPGNFRQTGEIRGFTSGQRFYQKGPVNFWVNFENTGTVHFEPKGIIEVRNIFGRKVGSANVEGQVVLPTNLKKLNITWDTHDILIGRYTASAVLYDGAGNPMTAEPIVFYAFPVWYSVGFVVAVVLVFFILRFLKRRVRIQVSLQ